MKTAHLQRLETGPEGTFGALSLDGILLVTGELPWADNAPGVSRIPVGRYALKWLHSPKFGRHVYHLQDVPGRTVIEVHPGNFCAAPPLKSNTDGCILLGIRRGILDGQAAVMESRDAVTEFEAYLAGENAEIVITETYEGGDL